jgi:hypothetical protein
VQEKPSARKHRKEAMPEGKDVSRELTGIPFQQQLTNTESHMDVTFGVGA